MNGKILRVVLVCCVAVWLCGCVAVWLCGCVVVWLRVHSLLCNVAAGELYVVQLNRIYIERE